MSDRIVALAVSPYVTWQGPESAIPAHLQAVGGQVEAGRATETQGGERAASGAVVASSTYGRRKVSGMLADWSALREAVRCGDVVAVQTAFDACEEWVDFAFHRPGIAVPEHSK